MDAASTFAPALPISVEGVVRDAGGKVVLLGNERVTGSCPVDALRPA